MECLNVFVAQFNEDEIVFIPKSTLKGMYYLQFIGKIHWEMKAGNGLCDREGRAKLPGWILAGWTFNGEL